MVGESGAQERWSSPSLSEERIVAEVYRAYSYARQVGPVHLVFTDRRLLVFWLGPHSILHRREMYRAWKQNPGIGPTWRVGAGGPLPTGRELAWELPYLRVGNLWVRRMIGPWADRTVALLMVGVLGPAFGGPAPSVGYGPAGTLIFAIPETQVALRGFLESTPVAGLVNRGWLIGRRKRLLEHGARLP